MVWRGGVDSVRTLLRHTGSGRSAAVTPVPAFMRSGATWKSGCARREGRVARGQGDGLCDHRHDCRLRRRVCPAVLAFPDHVMAGRGFLSAGAELSAAVDHKDCMARELATGRKIQLNT